MRARRSQVEFRGYNPQMEALSNPEISSHDATLIDWFLSLEPAERLAELESRIAFFNSVRPDAAAKLPPDSRAP